MSWVPIRRGGGAAAEAIVLKVTRDGAAGRATLLLPEAVLQAAGLAAGDRVALFRGEGAHAARLALRRTTAADGFRLARQGRRARLSVALAACGLALPEGEHRLGHELAEDLLQLLLPAAAERPAPDGPTPERPAAAPVSAPAGGAPGGALPARHGGAWSEVEDARLRQMREQGLSSEAIARALGRTRAAVYLRASQLRLPRPRRPAPAPRAGLPGAGLTGAGLAGAGLAGARLPAGPARPPRAEAVPSVLAQAAAWLRQQGLAVAPAAAGMFRVAGETVTALRLIQIANDRRARQSRPLPPLPLPSPDEIRRA